MAAIVRPARQEDRAAWDPLWQGYLAFYRTQLPTRVTELTWQRFFDTDEPMFALVAEMDGALVGLAHYLFHRNTWLEQPVCYFEDLFTAEAARGQGVGLALIEAVAAAAKVAGSQRLYWMTEEGNATARRLYDRVAVYSGFIQYRRSP